MWSNILENLYQFYFIPDPETPLQSWIGAAIIGASALISGLLANRAKKKEREYAKQESELAFQREREMIAEQNEYNSPANQMSRYQEAGLNPNLVYSQGQPGQQSSTASYQPSRGEFHPMAIPDILSMYQNFQMNQAQVDSVRANTENVRQRTINEAERNFLLRIQGKTGEVDLKQKEYLYPYQAAIVGNQARASEAKLAQEWQRVTNLAQTGQMQVLEQEYKRKAMTAVDLDNEKREAEILYRKYQNQWAKAGITSSDNLILRILVRMLNDTGFQGDISSIFNK